MTFMHERMSSCSAKRDLCWTEHAMGSLSLLRRAGQKYVGSYFGSEDNVFALLRAQPAANVIVSEALGVSIGGHWVPEHT